MFEAQNRRRTVDFSAGDWLNGQVKNIANVRHEKDGPANCETQSRRRLFCKQLSEPSHERPADAVLGFKMFCIIAL